MDQWQRALICRRRWRLFGPQNPPCFIAIHGLDEPSLGGAVKHSVSVPYKFTGSRSTPLNPVGDLAGGSGSASTGPKQMQLIDLTGQLSSGFKGADDRGQ